MIPIRSWDGPRYTAQEQQQTAAIQRQLNPTQFYASSNWNMAALDALEGGLFTKVCIAGHVGHVPVIEDLLQRGASLTKRSQGGWTALHAAVHAQQLDAAACLLGAAGGVLAKMPCDGGLTPLMFACEPTVPLAFARILLPASDFSAQDINGRRAFDHARQNNRIDIESLLEVSAFDSPGALTQLSEPSGRPDAQMVITLLSDLAEEVREWRHRARDIDYIQMARCWPDLLAVHRASIQGEDEDTLESRRAVANFNALRVRVLQRSPSEPISRPISDPCAKLSGDLAEEIDRLNRLHAVAAQRQHASHSTLPFEISLAPIRLLLLSIEESIRTDVILTHEGQACLDRARSEVQDLLSRSGLNESSLHEQMTHSAA